MLSVANSSHGSPHSDFLFNAKPRFNHDADHTGLDKVKRRLIECLAVVRLRALIAQEAEAEEVTPKKAIKVPSADDEQKEKTPLTFGEAKWPPLERYLSRVVS